MKQSTNSYTNSAASNFKKISKKYLYRILFTFTNPHWIVEPIWFRKWFNTLLISLVLRHSCMLQIHQILEGYTMLYICQIRLYSIHTVSDGETKCTTYQCTSFSAIALCNKPKTVTKNEKRQPYDCFVWFYWCYAAGCIVVFYLTFLHIDITMVKTSTAANEETRRAKKYNNIAITLYSFTPCICIEYAYAYLLIFIFI